MKNDSNAVRGRHLESLANMFIGKITSVDSIVAGLLEELEPFTGATSIAGGTDGLVPAPAAGDEVKFLCGDGTWSTVASGSCILDTVCPSVNGGLWYEVANGTPVVKIYYNGTEYPLGGAEDTELTVVPSPLTVPAGSSATATIDCNSGGEITVTSLTEGVRVERSGKVITVYHAAGIDTASVKISAAATLGYTPAEIQLPVEMEAVDPNLQVALTSGSTINCNSSNATATVSYNAACTVTPDITPSPNVPYTYTGGVISVPYADIDSDVTFTVSLAASPGFSTATKTFTVTMAKLDPQLTVTPSASTVPYAGSITAAVSYSGGGTITAKIGDTVLPYSDNTITIPHVSDITEATITVELTASTGYTAASTSFTVTMAKPVTILKVTPSATATKGDPVTATVECNSGGEISVVVSDSTNIDWDWDGETITLPFYLYNQDTKVTVTVSVTANGVYSAKETSFSILYVGCANSNAANNLIACLPFDTSPTEDICGRYTWSTSGDVSISDSMKALYLNGNSQLIMGGNLSFASSNYIAFHFWLYVDSGSTNGGSIIDAFNTYNSQNKSVYLRTGSANTLVYGITDANGSTTQGTANCTFNRWHYIEFVVSGANWRVWLYVDGAASNAYCGGGLPSISPIQYVWIGRSSQNKFFKGYIDNLKIYNTVVSSSAAPSTRPS